MRAMNSVDTYRTEGTFKAFGEFEVERSGGRARVTFRNSVGENGHIIVPPNLYSADPNDGTWRRSDIGTGGLYDRVAPLLLLGAVIYPREDIPLRFYEVTSAGVQDIDGVPTNRFRITVDWSRILDWLEDEDKLTEVSGRSIGAGPEEFKAAYREITSQQTRPLNIWVD